MQQFNLRVAAPMLGATASTLGDSGTSLCVRTGRIKETSTSVDGQLAVGSFPELKARMQVLVRSLSGRAMILQVHGALGPKALWVVIVQKTRIPEDDFGFIIGGKLLRREGGWSKLT